MKQTLYTPIIYLTVGISGSGKSHLYQKQLHIYGIEINNDTVRKELTGDISNHGMNVQVFEEVDKRTVALLASGSNIVLTNTNLHLDKINELAEKFPYNPIKVFVLKDSLNLNLCKERIKKDISEGIDRAKTPDDVVNHQFENLNIFLEEVKEGKASKNITFFWIQSNGTIEEMEF